jgi:hypothetical protein
MSNEKIYFAGGHCVYRGGRPKGEIKNFLEARCVAEVTHLAMGTVWPRPHPHHLPATSENLHDLAGLVEQCSTIEFVHHLHAYIGRTVLLAWYDVFCGDPFWIHRDVAKERLQVFCEALSVDFGRIEE